VEKRYLEECEQLGWLEQVDVLSEAELDGRKITSCVCNRKELFLQSASVVCPSLALSSERGG
jgi:hypothetical protein